MNINKTVFLPKVSHIVLNYAFLLFWSFFAEIHREFLFVVNSDYLWNEYWNTQNFCYSYHVWKWESPEENLDLFKQMFLMKQVKGYNINKNFFFMQMSHILLNYAFLLFGNIFGKIHRELFFLDIKVTKAETSIEILRKFVFLTKLNFSF